MNTKAMDRHSCSFDCEREACIRRQRDELWLLVKPIYEEMQRRYVFRNRRMTFSQTMKHVADILQEAEGIA